MALTYTPLCEFNTPAPNFRLPDAHGTFITRDMVKKANGLLVMFICNHCPYVKAIQEKLVSTSERLLKESIGCVAIMSNDYLAYPEDSPEQMLTIAKSHQYPFSYLIDQTQEIAKAYGAVCTPDFFGYNSELKLQYRGRLDSARSDTSVSNPIPELLNAMSEIIKTGKGPITQHPSMGCNIKWKADTRLP
ncbi:MAG: thioredoxin family protein [Methylacidiphilales bacterium]|nr:thioredoxin family protein [Candidatus Methylacidiphilales bacterium]